MWVNEVTDRFAASQHCGCQVVPMTIIASASVVEVDRNDASSDVEISLQDSPGKEGSEAVRVRVHEDEDRDVAKAHTSKFRLYLMCMGDFGLAFTWVLKYAVTTPFFRQTLRGGPVVSHVVWSLGPLSGLITAPLVGVLSDRCESRFGRRRPYIFGGMVASILGMNMFSLAGRLSASRPLALLVGVVGFAILDFSTNVIMFPSRALMADLLAADQQHDVQSAAAVLASLAEIAAGAYIFSWDAPVSHIEKLFFTASVVMFASVSVSLFMCPEQPLKSGRTSQRGNDQGAGVVESTRENEISDTIRVGKRNAEDRSANEEPIPPSNHRAANSSHGGPSQERPVSGEWPNAMNTNDAREPEHVGIRNTAVHAGVVVDEAAERETDSQDDWNVPTVEMDLLIANPAPQSGRSKPDGYEDGFDSSTGTDVHIGTPPHTRGNHTSDPYKDRTHVQKGHDDDFSGTELDYEEQGLAGDDTGTRSPNPPSSSVVGDVRKVLASAVHNFPKQLGLVGIVYFLAWACWFVSLPAYSVWIGEAVLGGDPDAEAGTIEAANYQRGVTVFSLANIFKAIVALGFAANYPKMVRVVGDVGERAVFAVPFFFFALFLWRSAFTESVWVAGTVVALGAIPFIATQTIPTAIAVTKFPENIASNLGIMNLFCVTAQLVDTLYTGLVAKYAGEGVVMRIAAVWALLAALAAVPFL